MSGHVVLNSTRGTSRFPLNFNPLRCVLEVDLPTGLWGAQKGNLRCPWLSLTSVQRPKELGSPAKWGLSAVRSPWGAVVGNRGIHRWQACRDLNDDARQSVRFQDGISSLASFKNQRQFLPQAPGDAIAKVLLLGRLRLDGNRGRRTQPSRLDWQIVCPGKNSSMLPKSSTSIV